MSQIYSPSIKRRPKKKSSLIERKLSAMNKNIQNANDAINRPDEFYMNLFTKILRKDSFMLDNVGEKTKKSTKLLNCFSSAFNVDEKSM